MKRIDAKVTSVKHQLLRGAKGLNETDFELALTQRDVERSESDGQTFKDSLQVTFSPSTVKPLIIPVSISSIRAATASPRRLIFAGDAPHRQFVEISGPAPSEPTLIAIRSAPAWIRVEPAAGAQGRIVLRVSLLQKPELSSCDGVVEVGVKYGDRSEIVPIDISFRSF